MRFLNIMLFIAACTVIFLLGMESEAPTGQVTSNPMKINQEQYARIQSTYVADSSK